MEGDGASAAIDEVAGARAEARVTGEGRGSCRRARTKARVAGMRAVLSCKGTTGSQFRVHSGFTVPL